MIKQYRVKVETVLTVTVDEEQTDIESVLSDMYYEFESESEHADIPNGEIVDWDITSVKDDTIKI
jgi:hypothetical protein